MAAKGVEGRARSGAEAEGAEVGGGVGVGSRRQESGRGREVGKGREQAMGRLVRQWSGMMGALVALVASGAEVSSRGTEGGGWHRGACGAAA